MDNLVLFLIIAEPEMEEKETKKLRYANDIKLEKPMEFVLLMVKPCSCSQRACGLKIWVSHVISPTLTQAFMMSLISTYWYKPLLAV